jgi:hypothetical protein
MLSAMRRSNERSLSLINSYFARIALIRFVTASSRFLSRSKNLEPYKTIINKMKSMK